MNKMKILHVWDQSGTGSTLGKYMDTHYNTVTHVLTRVAFDPYNQTTYGQRLTTGTLRFAVTCFNKALTHDIIHIDSFEKLLPFLQWHKKPLIIHYHGSDLRNSKKHQWQWADRILYGTPDLAQLLPESAVYLPTPIDTGTFKPTSPKRFGAVYFTHWYESPQLANLAATDLNMPLTIIHNPINYKNMPSFLNQYEYVIDRFAIPSLSRLALEALACGCKVINWNLDVIEGLPSEHRVENVAKQLYQIYKEVI